MKARLKHPFVVGKEYVSCNLHLKCRIPLFGRAVKDLPVMKEFYAHSINSQGQRHRLDNHLIRYG